MTFHSAIYRGEIFHARDDRHARRVFRYDVMMAVLELDELDELDRALVLFSRGRPNLFSFRDRDYASGTSPSAGAATRDLRGELAALRAANGLPLPHATRLVTNLRAFGYLFNPVSFFLDYDERGAITAVIAEVNNTYGGHLRYVLGPHHRVREAGPNDTDPGDGPRSRARDTDPGDGPRSRARDTDPGDGPRSRARDTDPGDGPRSRARDTDPGDGPRSRARDTDPGEGPRSRARDTDPGDGPRSRARDTDPGDGPRSRARFRHVRELFVSPFLHGDVTYDFELTVPLDGARLAIAMRVLDAAGHQVLFASFAGTRAPMSDRTLALAALRYPFMTARVIGLIHWQALKLRLAGVPYLRPPGDHRPIANPPRAA